MSTDHTNYCISKSMKTLVILKFNRGENFSKFSKFLVQYFDQIVTKKLLVFRLYKRTNRKRISESRIHIKRIHTPQQYRIDVRRYRGAQRVPPSPLCNLSGRCLRIANQYGRLPARSFLSQWESFQNYDVTIALTNVTNKLQSQSNTFHLLFCLYTILKVATSRFRLLTNHYRKSLTLY